MDTTPHLDDSARETAKNKRRRQVAEATMIAEADAEIEAGLTIDEAEVDAWIDSLGTNRELPKPKPRR